MYKTMFSSIPVNYDSNNINADPIVEKPLLNSKKVGLSIKNLSSFDIIKFIVVSTITFILPRLLWEFYYKNFDPQNPPLKKLLTFLSGKSEQPQQIQQQSQPKTNASTSGEIKNFEVKPVFHPKKETGIIMDRERIKRPSVVSSQSSIDETLADSNSEITTFTKTSNSSLYEGSLINRGKEMSISSGKDMNVSRRIDEDSSINIKTLMSTITNNLMPLQESGAPNTTEYVLSKYRGIISDCEEMVNNFIISDALSRSELYSLLEPLNNSINKTENFFLAKRNITAIVIGRKAQGKSRLVDAVFREDCDIIDEKIGEHISVSKIYIYIN